MKLYNSVIVYTLYPEMTVIRHTVQLNYKILIIIILTSDLISTVLMAGQSIIVIRS